MKSYNIMMRFYLQPKIKKLIFPPPRRPIISGNNSPTGRISQFVDHLLKKTSQRNIKGTTSSLNIIDSHPTMLEDTILMCAPCTQKYNKRWGDSGWLCNETYHPLSKTKLNRRMYEHFNTIKVEDKMYNIGAHFSGQIKHNSIQDVKNMIFVIYS